MQTIEVKNLTDLFDEIRKLQTFALDKQIANPGVSDIIFRGQQDARWELKTTLERYSRAEITMPGYHRMLQRIAPAVASYTGREWDLDTEFDFDRINFPHIPAYPFSVYVRHHGFPSPLLDWTRSPYLALYFALCDAGKNNGDAAIYAYIDNPEGVHSKTAGQPVIINHGPYTVTHARHFVQQAQYTVCINQNDSGAWAYTSHENCFAIRDDDQDYLRKIVFSTDLKGDALEQLDEMNINAYSLFNNEEGLMHMMAFREIPMNLEDNPQAEKLIGR